MILSSDLNYGYMYSIYIYILKNRAIDGDME